MRRMIFGVLAITSVAAMALAADSGIGTRADADALQTKLVQIATNGLAQKPVSRKTPVTEREVNAFLRTHASESLPQGVIDPLVTILADGHLTARAMVDLDEVRNSKERGTFSPWTILRGRVPVEASGLLRTENGVGAFTLDSATVGGVPVPKSVLQELVAYYSKSESQPEGLNFEAPFRLPARIRELRTTIGQALVVQ
jgi:hypothetical protein